MHLRIAVILTVAAGLAAPGVALGAGDFGDAPDGAPSGYAGGAAGAFPSKAASRGPMHEKTGALVLGIGESAESDSKQVDRDDMDDGVGLTVGAACSETGKLELALDGSRLPAARRVAPDARIVYVNLWADWNRDGDWDDPGGCGTEWSVRNLPVRMDSLQGGFGSVSVSFQTGEQTQEFWYRVTVTLDQPAPDAGGRALQAYTYGETEDSVRRPPSRVAPKKKTKRPTQWFDAVCRPGAGAHGTKVSASVVVSGPGAASVKLRRIAGDPVAIQRTAFGFALVAQQPADPPFRIKMLTVKVRLSNAWGSIVRTCRLTITHAPRFPHRCGKPQSCGALDQPPGGPDPKIDNANWRNATYKGEKVAVLNVFSTNPLGRPVDAIFIPLANQNPAWQYARVVESFVKNDAGAIGPASCGFAAAGGGSGGLLCNFSSPIARALEIQLLIQVFNVVTGRQVDLPTVAIVGAILYQGAKAAAFSAPFK